MSAGEYKEFKCIRKESLRDNMTDLEILITDIGEITIRELVKEHKPYGLNENRKMANIGGSVAYNTRKDIENKLGRSVVTKENSLEYKYVNDIKVLKNIEEVDKKINNGGK